MPHAYTSPESITRPARVLVNLDAIGHNYRQFVAHVGEAAVMPVVKANAYGHGLVDVAKYLDALNPPCFGVATYEEAQALRAVGIDTPILVFGGMYDELIPQYIQQRITLTASSISKLKAIDAAAEALGMRPSVHLKIDTGMERIGVHHYNAESLITAATQCTHLQVEGVYSHFATADDPDEAFYQQQLARFTKVSAYAKQQFDHPILCHAANSAAALKDARSHFDMVRIGISLYGVTPAPNFQHSLDLRTALRWESKVVYFKVVRGGDSVSYGRAWAPTENTRVITVPVGYADGFSRSLSNKAEVMINGHAYPVVGTVCMDQFMVDIGPEGTAYNGDTVTMIGDGIDAHMVAEWQSSIAYEVLTRISSRVPRGYVFDQQPAADD